MSDWIVGRPANGVVTTFAWDAKGHLSKFTQDGWEVSYMQYQNEMQPALPSKINIRNQKMNVRLVIERWDTSPQSSAFDAKNSAQAQ
jgi:outer membrane lipoprotein LolB